MTEERTQQIRAKIVSKLYEDYCAGRITREQLGEHKRLRFDGSAVGYTLAEFPKLKVDIRHRLDAARLANADKGPRISDAAHESLIQEVIVRELGE